MFAPRGQRAFAARLVILVLLALSLIPALPTGAAPARQAAPGEPEIGTVSAIGLDNSGNGWAFAYPKPQTFATSFLIRIEKGAWRVAADSVSNPELLAPDLALNRIALTGDGKDGWAIGSMPDVDNEKPIFWRLDNGAWRPVRNNLPTSTRLFDLALSADGKDGWISAFDLQTSDWSLLRLQNGSWDFVAVPPNVVIHNVGINASSNSAWIVGIGPASDQVAYYRRDNGWVPLPNLPLTGDDLPLRVAVDDGGNAWVLAAAAPSGEQQTGERRGNLVIRSKLLRLKAGAPPVFVKFDLVAPRQGGADIFVNLHDIVLDDNGKGWVSGDYYLGSEQQPGAIEDKYQPLLIRLDDDSANVIAPTAAGLPAQQNFGPLVLGLSPDGGHTWVGGHDGINFGHLYQLREPWQHDQPAPAAPLNGAARCFGPSDYCLRGVFAAYWQAHGGLDLFGYPLTPEVQETIGGKSYTVQYTQRARFELHPEYAGTPNEVLLGLLGNTLVNDRLNETPFKPAPKVTSFDVRWFAATQHNIARPILPYWEQHGGIPVFGLPRSESFQEQNAADSKTYLVQYFERNRIEYHPEYKGTAAEFLLGLLGVEQFRQTYGYTP